MGQNSVNTGKSYRNVVIGAGITGLSAAYYLGKDTLVLEASRLPGGAFNSVKHGRYVLDLGERFVRITKDTKELFDKIFGPSFFREQDLSSEVQIGVRRYMAPFQYNLYGMEPKKLEYCLQEAKRSLERYKAAGLKDFKSWILANFGKGIANEFMLPYNRKIWCADPAVMAADWFFDGSVPRGDLARIIEGAVRSPEERGSVRQKRYYPKKGGAASVPEHMAKRIKGDILYNARVVKVDPVSRKVTVESGGEIGYENLISTAPLNELVRMVRPLPERIREMGRKLKYNSVLCAWVGIKSKVDEKCHWMYFPEKRFMFSRLYFPNNFSDDLAPAGRSVIGAVITYRGARAAGGVNRKKLLGQLAELGFLKRQKDVEFIEEATIKYGFCMPLLGTRKVSQEIRGCLDRRGIFSIGRYGEWKYSGMEHALMDGKNAALRLKKERWYK